MNFFCDCTCIFLYLWYIIRCTQTYGVTVAQVILVHFVEVRILVGLPFFLSFFVALSVRNPCKKQLLTIANEFARQEFFFLRVVFCRSQKTGLLTFWRLLCASRPLGCDARARSGFALRRILVGLPFFLSFFCGVVRS